MKYFFKIHNVMKEKGKRNNFRDLLVTVAENFSLILNRFTRKKLLTNLIFVQP